MIPFRFLPLILKQIIRSRARSLLTVVGVALAMFLFVVIQSMQGGLKASTEEGSRDVTLVVYRENRYCPFTSQLPEYYGTRIEKIPGVASAVPMKVVVSNCRTSLDVVTFRGVPPDRLAESKIDELTIISGSIDDWLHRTDAVLVGDILASRRGLKVGDRFDANGLAVSVAGVFESTSPQDRNLAYVDLDFLQRAPGVKDGVVTQFNVKVDDPTRLDEIALAIDAEFASAADPTYTSSEKAFVARAAGDLVGLIGFTRWVGLGCLVAVLALVANSIILAVQGRVREHAVLQTLGFQPSLIGRLVITESLALSLMGGAIGTAGATAFLHVGSFSMSNEGLSMNFSVGPGVWLPGLAAAAVLGILAGLFPAVQVSMRSITESFRAV